MKIKRNTWFGASSSRPYVLPPPNKREHLSNNQWSTKPFAIQLLSLCNTIPGHFPSSPPLTICLEAPKTSCHFISSCLAHVMPFAQKPFSSLPTWQIPIQSFKTQPHCKLSLLPPLSSDVLHLIESETILFIFVSPMPKTTSTPVFSCVCCMKSLIQINLVFPLLSVLTPYWGGWQSVVFQEKSFLWPVYHPLPPYLVA